MSDDVIWLRPEQPARGPRPSRSRDEIVAAGVGIADVEGVDAVSMRRVASAVGLGAMSLYRYVSGKHDLLDLMLDSVAGEYEYPAAPSGDWRADLRGVLHQSRRIMHRHPWVPQLAITRLNYGPNALRYLEFCLAALRPAGLDSGSGLETLALINAGVSAYVANEVAEQEESRRTGTSVEQRRAAMTRYLNSVVESGEYPLFSRAISESGVTPNADARFDSAVDKLLDGLVR